MKMQYANEADIELCRKMCFAFAWAQAVIGLFLLWQTVTPWVHGVLAVLAATVLLLAKKGEDSRACRVIARVAAGLPLPVLVFFLVDEGIAIAAGRESWLYISCMLCALCLPLGLYMEIGAVRMSFRRGRYDRVIACLYQVWLLAMAVVATQTECRRAIVWMWDHNTVRLVWLGVVAASTVLIFLYAWQRPFGRRASEEAAE